MAVFDKWFWVVNETICVPIVSRVEQSVFTACIV